MNVQNKSKQKSFSYRLLHNSFSLDDDPKLDYFRYLNSPLESSFFALSIIGMLISLWFVFIQPSSGALITSNGQVSQNVVNQVYAIHTWALAFFIVFSVIVAANLVAVMPNREDPKWLEIRKQFKEQIKKKYNL
ncbi:MAG: hypothetical protein GWP09_00125 [Nitrospiraceae bacterium]|nr:hypothetical protein [Nitrospiraceae bacterium]